ncbi:tyrosine-type recombinase/integrase [Bacteroides ovatus]|nr:tyrosine-type recombinase/integrase [Bacteroides ovatus]
MPILFHMSRHTFATMCLNNGVKMENVSKMLGHTNVRTTQQYAKVLNAEVEKDFEMLERILS